MQGFNLLIKLLILYKNHNLLFTSTTKGNTINYLVPSIISDTLYRLNIYEIVSHMQKLSKDLLRLNVTKPDVPKDKKIIIWD